MKFEKCVENLGVRELKRIASAHVVDSKHMNSKEELRQSILKTAGQYFSKDNIEGAMNRILLSDDREDRTITRIMIKEILLNKDEYMERKKVVFDEIIIYEQDIINASNEMNEKQLNDRNMVLFNFVLETAWESGDSISPDEKNLIEKIRKRLDITQREYRMLEARLGRFPKRNNELHTQGDVESVRLKLQQNGILFVFRNSDGEDFDIIPNEIAEALKAYYGKEMRNHGYKQLISHKILKNKEYLLDILTRGNVKCDGYMKVNQLQDLVLERIRPSHLIGGYSPRDGLSKENLQQWCNDLNLQTSGSKDELISRIITHYDGFQEIKVDTADERETLFAVYEHLARRDLKFLRKQGIINKDLDCEKKFEEATNYMFEKIFRQKPLKLAGTEHPDGILSYQNKFIMWDNKSKETPVKLKEFISQFRRYIETSERPVGTFMVIAAEFTDDSEAECMNFALNSDTSILLVRTEDIRELALKWKELHGNNETSFNLGYFKQSGKFKKEHIKL